MKMLPELIEALMLVDPDKLGNAKIFDAILSEIVELRNPHSVVPLLGLLRDTSVFDELMFSIIHSIEIFDDHVYVAEILNGIVPLSTKAPRWASIIIMRMLNSEPTRLELVRQLRNAQPDVKRTVGKLIEAINAQSTDFLPKTIAVLIATRV
jgi:hypothetical protein